MTMAPVTSRRTLLKAAAAVAATAAVEPVALEAAAAAAAESKTMIGVPFQAKDRIRLGVVGCGGRGSSVMGEFLATEHVDVTAVCDIVPEKVARAQKRVRDLGQPEPAGYSKGDHDFENLMQRDDIDVVLIATPWDWHVPMALYAMNHGKHALSEVPAAQTVADCWSMVDTSEKTRRHCIMLENCCYGSSEMLVLNMVRAGVFGDLTHGEAAYIHDLRGELFSNGGEGLWRRAEHWNRNGNLYPTHGLGPVAQYMDINRGDRFDYLVSVSSPQKGLLAYAEANFPPDSPKRKETFACGDMNTSIIKTALGRTILLQHDTTSPRPYDRLNMISGTKGTFRGYPDRICIDGQKEGETWKDLTEFTDKYASDLWKRVGALAAKRGGHGGMDFVMAFRLIECMREGLVPDMDVYDAASWSAPVGLSEQSVKNGSAPAKFPDFTRGKWKEKR